MITNQTTYDVTIADAMRRYLVMWDWRWLKAQLFQESQLNPNAVNTRSGAKGIGQFMDATWQDAIVNCGFPHHASPFDASFAIPGAAWYMSHLRSSWKTDRPEDDRRKLALASYNCGFGNMVRAQQYAGGARSYETIIRHLPEVTGESNAAETTGYVDHIYRWYDQLTANEVAP